MAVSTVDRNLSLTQFIYEKKIHLKIRLLQPSRFNCLCALPLRHRCCLICARERHKTNAANRSIQWHARRSRHAETGCGANGRSRSSDSGPSKPALHPVARRTRGGRTADAVSTPEHGRPATDESDITVSAKVTEQTFPAQSNDAAADNHI